MSVFLCSLFFATPVFAEGQFGSAEQKVIACNQARRDVRDLMDHRAVSQHTPVKPSSQTLRALMSCELESQRASVALSENFEALYYEISFCDTACEDISPEYSCFNQKDNDLAYEIAERRERGAGQAYETAKSCRATFISMCSGDLKSCEKSARGNVAEDKTLSDKFDKFVLNTEVAKLGLLSGKDLLDTIKEIKGQAATTTTGDTNVQQNYSPNSQLVNQYNANLQNPTIYPKLNTSSPSAGLSPGALGGAPSASGDSAGNGLKDTLAGAGNGIAGGAKNLGRALADGAKKAASGIKKGAATLANNPGALALGATLQNQYTQNKQNNKSEREAQAAISRLQQDSARRELAAKSLLVKGLEFDSQGTGGIDSGQTGLGSSSKAGQPVASLGPPQANVGQVSGTRPATGSSSGVVSSSPILATGQAGPAGSKGSPSSKGQAAATSSSAPSGQPNSGGDKSKYTEDRGFFGAIASALGLGKKNKNRQVRRVRGDGGQKTLASGAQTSTLQSPSQIIDKHWNKTLGRVEIGSSRGLASIQKGDPVGVTAKNQSIFNSICSRYSIFQKDGKLAAGKAICPGQ